MDQYSNYGGQQDPSSGSYSSYQYNDSYNQGGYTVPTSSSDYYYGGSNPPSGGNNSSSGGSTQQPPTTPATTQGYTSQRNDNYEGSAYSPGYNNYNNYPAPTASGNYQTGQNSSAGSSATPYNSGGGSYSGASKTGYTDRNSDYGDSSSYGGNKNPYGDSYYKPRENGREGGYGGPPPKEGGSYDNYGSRSESGYKDNYVDGSVVQTISDTIYISNLSKDVTEEKLAEKFGSLGMLKIDRKTQKPKIWIYYDKVTGIPKGDATLTYEDPDSTAAAIKYFDNQKFLDQVIKVEMSVRKVQPSGFRTRGRSRGRGFSRGIRGSGGPPPRDGDWICESCSANNFARRMECYKCHTPRSNLPGDGGYGGRYSGAPRGGYRGRRGGHSYGRYDDDRGYGGGGYRNNDSSHGYDQGYRRQNKQDDRQDRRENSRYIPY